MGRQVADQIREEDEQRVHGRPFIYACLSGWATSADDSHLTAPAGSDGACGGSACSGGACGGGGNGDDSSDNSSDSDTDDEDVEEVPALNVIKKVDVDEFFTRNGETPFNARRLRDRLDGFLNNGM